MMKNTLSKDSSGSDDENSVDARDEEMDGAGGEKNEVVAGPPLPFEDGHHEEPGEQHPIEVVADISVPPGVIEDISANQDSLKEADFVPINVKEVKWKSGTLTEPYFHLKTPLRKQEPLHLNRHVITISRGTFRNLFFLEWCNTQICMRCRVTQP